MEILKNTDGSMNVEAEMKKDYMKTAEKISSTAKEAKLSGNTVINNIQTYARENPGKALGIAVGVGAVLTLALMKAFGRNETANDQIIAGLVRKAEVAWEHFKSGVAPAVKNVKDPVGG